MSRVPGLAQVILVLVLIVVPVVCAVVLVWRGHRRYVTKQKFEHFISEDELVNLLPEERDEPKGVHRRAP